MRPQWVPSEFPMQKALTLRQTKPVVRSAPKQEKRELEALVNQEIYLWFQCVHSGIRPYKCEECGMTFARQDSWKGHTHSKIRSFLCSICGKTFARRNIRDTHERAHLNDRRYPCSYCGKKFMTNQQRTNHERTHTGEKPFQCTGKNIGLFWGLKGQAYTKRYQILLGSENLIFYVVLSLLGKLRISRDLALASKEVRYEKWTWIFNSNFQIVADNLLNSINWQLISESTREKNPIHVNIVGKNSDICLPETITNVMGKRGTQSWKLLELRLPLQFRGTIKFPSKSMYHLALHWNCVLL